MTEPLTQEVRVPDLEGATEVILGSWLVGAGQHVVTGDTVAEVQTDKVNAEIEAAISGTVTETLFEEGATVRPGEVIARIRPD